MSMYFYNSKDEKYNNLIDEIALKDSYFKLLEERYKSVASHIDKHKSDMINEIKVFPQGSVKQGTIIKHSGNDSFDIDVVIEFVADITRFTQKQIRNEISCLLSDYVKANGMKEDIYENKRSYSLRYSDNNFDFHIDFTPVIKFNHLYYLTNRESICYDKLSFDLEKTNPRALANWFESENNIKYRNFYQKEFEQLKKSELTKLQKCIMLTKFSKDLVLNASLKSIILTIEMTKCFDYGLSYEDNFENFKKRIIDKFSSDYVQITNPTEPDENFAEKFNKLEQQEKNEFIEALSDWEFVREEYIDKVDYSHAENYAFKPSADLKVKAEFTGKGFSRYKQFESGSPVKKGKNNKVKFSVLFDDLNEYLVEWQVTNEGNSAVKNGSSKRGRIEEHNRNKHSIVEPLSFVGQHWVRCILTNKKTQEKIISDKFKVNIV